MFNAYDRVISESAAPADTENGGIAAALCAQIAEELTAKPLKPEVDEVFTNALFPPEKPNKANKEVATAARPGQYEGFAEGLISLNVRIKTYQSFLSALMNDAIFMTDALRMKDTDSLSQRISMHFDNAGGVALKALQTGAPAITAETRGTTTSAMANTRDLVVRKTGTGYDLEVVKITGTDSGYWNTFVTAKKGAGASSQVGSGILPDMYSRGGSPEFDADPSNETATVSRDFREFYFSAFLSEFGQAVHAAMIGMHKFLFNDAPSKSNVKSATARIELGRDLSFLNTLLMKIPGVREAIGRVVVFPRQIFNDAVITNLGPLFQVSIRRSLSETLAPRALASKTGRPAYPGFNTIPEVMLPYNGILIHVGYSLSLTNEMVDYIIQSEDHGAASLLLTRWFNRWNAGYFRLPNTQNANRTQVPRCLTSSTEIKRLNDMRKKLGFPITDAIGNDNGVAVSSDGSIVVYPRTQDIDPEVVGGSEKALSDGMDSLYRLGVPVGSLARNSDTKTYEQRSRNVLTLDLDFVDGKPAFELDELHSTFTTRAQRFSHVVVGTDPTSGLVVQTSSNALNFETVKDDGAVPAGDMEIGDALGYNFASPGQADVIRSAGRVLGQIIDYRTVEEISMLEGAFTSAVVSAIRVTDPRFFMPRLQPTRSNTTWEDMKTADRPFLAFYAISAIARTYEWLLSVGVVPSIDELKSQAKAMQEAFNDEFSINREGGVIDAALYSRGDSLQSPSEIVAYYSLLALHDASDSYTNGRLRAEYSGRATEIVTDPAYVAPLKSAGLGEIGNVRGYLGGSLWVCACRAIFDADRRKVFSALYETNLMPSKFLMRTVMPLAFMIGHAAPDAARYEEAVEKHVESNETDDSVDEEALVLAGTEDFTLMPHQFRAQKQLSKKIPPKYATLDIHPGGGKTILGIRDILWCASVMDEPIKPLVIAPKGLVNNWCEDLLIATKDWNVVPITTDTVKEWGIDRMQDLLANAPVNTIYVVADTFLSQHHGRFDADIGGARVSLMAQTEFMRRFKFNYVILDESHRAKNLDTQNHSSIKSMFLQSSVRFKRLATGTLAPNSVSDVVGQAALFSPGIFGDGREIEDASRSNADGSTNLDMADNFNKKAAATHARLSNYSTMATYKRKEWAFMLPNPIESFFPFSIDDPSVPNSSLHRVAYDAIYKRLTDLAKKEEEKKKRNAPTEEDSEDEEVGSLVTEGEGAASLGAMLVSNKELRSYWQRMEQMLSDPMGEPEAVEIFEAAGVKNFIPVKMRVIVDRIKKHFEVQPKFIEPTPDPENPDVEVIESQVHQQFEWHSGVRPFELDIAVVDGKRYLARKKKLGDPKRYRLPESLISPPNDPDYWKLESDGKVLVLCEYNRSGDAVIRALKKLAPKLAASAVRLGGGDDTKEMVEKFRYAPEVKILVANEQRVSEGHNMQVGSRIIRCDTPWSPGKVRQSHARIMRPDMRTAVFDENGKPGDMRREAVFIDWVMTNNTMEVVKVARVAAKDVKTTIFDEIGNERYDEISQWASMAEPPYNVDVLTDPTWINFDTYRFAKDPKMQHFKAKATINAIDSAEFAEMRLSSVSSMVAVKGAPVDPAAGFRILDNVPYVANQRIHDRWGFGLVPFREYYKHRAADIPFTDNRREYALAFNGLPVHTEWGNGVIVGVVQISTERFENEERRQTDPAFANLRIEYPDGSTRNVGATRVHVAMNAIRDPDLMSSAFSKKARSKTVPKNKRDRDVETSNEAAETKRIREEARIKDDVSKVIRETAANKERAAAESKKRAQNVKEGKAPNSGIESVVDGRNTVASTIKMPTGTNTEVRTPVRRAPVTKVDTAPDKSIAVYPTVYNGLLALYVNTSDSDYKELVKSFGFKVFGEYVYADSLYLKDFHGHLDHLDAVYGEGPFDTASAKRLEEIQNVFSEIKSQKFLYPVAYKLKNEIIEFFRTRHLDSRKPNILKAYPAFLRDKVRMMIDLKTNPHARKLIGKTSVGVTAKVATWKLHESMAINFVATATEGNKLLKQLQRAGYTITNLKAVTKAMTDVRIRPMADEPRK